MCEVTRRSRVRHTVIRPGPSPSELAASFARALFEGGPVLLRASELSDGGELAGCVLEELPRACASLSGHEFEIVCKQPHRLVERDRSTAREILPHHDRGSQTWLTSPQEVHRLPPGRRYLYTGFVLESGGESPGPTILWDLVALLHLSSGATSLSLSAASEILALRWVERQRVSDEASLRPRYTTLASLLGIPGAAAVALEAFDGETRLDEIAGIPDVELASLRRPCPCGSCRGEASAAICHLFQRALGVSLWSLAHSHGCHVTAHAGDLLMWNNFFFQHGNQAAGQGRIVSHRYLTVEDADHFDAWLRAEWSNRLRAVAEEMRAGRPHG